MSDRQPRDGRDGRDGVDGRDGIDGAPGLDGLDGLNGKDGQDGKDGRDGHDRFDVSKYGVFHRDDITNLTERMEIFEEATNRLMATITPSRDGEGFMTGFFYKVASA